MQSNYDHTFAMDFKRILVAKFKSIKFYDERFSRTNKPFTNAIRIKTLELLEIKSNDDFLSCLNAYKCILSNHLLLCHDVIWSD